MLPRAILDHVFDDEGLTRHLGDAEARVLIEWLVEQAEGLGKEPMPEEAIVGEVRKLCRRGRAISRFVQLWALQDEHGAACQLAASERFDWPLPDGPIEACQLMQEITWWETQSRRAA